MDFLSLDGLLALYAILAVSVLFPLYYFLVKHNAILKLITKSGAPLTGRENLEFFSEKLTGIIFIGIVPVTLFVLILKIHPSDLGFAIGEIGNIIYPLIIFLILIPFFSFYSSRNSNLFDISPGLRARTWRIKEIALSVSCWLIYLFGYEFLFRGILWFLCYNSIGFWWSMTINTVLYSLVHIPKGKIMTLGAIPLGILMCTLSSITGSFLPAFFIHSVMAISTELFSVHHNPGFQFRISRR
jgi:membrane protease YdiL (CAAX protease family)